MNLPAGTVTFLLTDIEGSTRLWEQHPDAMRAALTRHDALANRLIPQHEGILVKSRGEGDSLFAVFARATDAAQAALALQQALTAQPWPTPIPLLVRMALHTGEADLREADYYGPPVNRCARLRAIAHGGQILLSQTTQTLVRDALPASCSLRSLGEHRLRDLSRAESVFQMLHPALPSEFPPLKSLDNPALPNNLPLQMTSFIGREKQIAEVSTLLDKTRLLTLTGSGGCGKTRLGMQVAADLLEDYPDGVWVVELAALSDPALVVQEVAQALGIKEQTGQPLQQTLTDNLQARHLLLALDNCEHLLSACAQLTTALLRACPAVKVLTTSREPLGVAGELTYRVPSLSFPDPVQTQTPQSLSQYEAVCLFFERAQFHKPDFAVTDKNAPALASVCFHLDGIPLAIELAAARVRSLSVAEINSRLDSRFRLLTGGDRMALPRHQTLRATIDWSYDLLTEQERLLLSRQTVFVGGWTLSAAESVCGGEGIAVWELLDLLTSLVDKSLVVYEEREGEGRYTLLETVRQYAGERLDASGEAERVQGQHLAYFLALAEQAEPHLRGPEQEVWLARLEGEHDNLRSALAWCQGQEEEAEAGLRLTAAMFRFWEIRRGYLSAGRAYLAEALTRAGTAERTQVRAKALYGAGILAWRQGDYEAARGLHEESLAIRRELGDKRCIAQSLYSLGAVTSYQGDYGTARALLEESLAISRELGDKVGIATSLNGLGNMAYNQGDYGTARVLYEESLAINRELGHKQGIAMALFNLGRMARRSGDYAQAHRLLAECLEWHIQLGIKGGSLAEFGWLAADMGDAAQARQWFEQALREHRETGEPRETAEDLEGLAHLARLQSDWERAARLWGAAQSLREAIGTPPLPEERKEDERDQAAVREALGEAAFAAAWAEGRAMTLEQAIEYALAS
jgi:predicted ATPase/class 3 adenylate cyclase/Tfp pilus assembly protein PilF